MSKQAGLSGFKNISHEVRSKKLREGNRERLGGETEGMDLINCIYKNVKQFLKRKENVLIFSRT